MHAWVRRRQHCGQCQIVGCGQGYFPQTEGTLRFCGGRSGSCAFEGLGLAVPQGQHSGRGQLRALLDQVDQHVGALELLLHFGCRGAPRGLDPRFGLHPCRQRRRSRHDGTAPARARTHDVVVEHCRRRRAAGRRQCAERGVPVAQPAAEFGRIFGDVLGAGGQPRLPLSEYFDGKPLWAFATCQRQRRGGPGAQFPASGDQRRQRLPDLLGHRGVSRGPRTRQHVARSPDEPDAPRLGVAVACRQRL